MTDRAKNVLSLVLILASIAVLAGAYAYSRRPPSSSPPPQAPAVADEIPVGFEELVAPANFSFDGGVPDPGSAEVVAVFLLRPSVCPPCLGEVQDYVVAIDQLNQRGIEVMPLALVFTERSGRARHFIRTAALPLPTGYGYPAELASRLGRRDGRTVLQQLVFIDTVRGTLFYRIMLPNTVTPLVEKERLLERVLAARSPEQPLATSTSIKGEL